MVWELAEIEVRAGTEEKFEAAVAEAKPLFQQAQGCYGMQLRRSVERPAQYRLVVEWETVEHHTVGFRESPAFLRWRELVGPYFARPPVVEHLHQVFETH
jgi:heme-degrading monooxygenase HmoA